METLIGLTNADFNIFTLLGNARASVITYGGAIAAVLAVCLCVFGVVVGLIKMFGSGQGKLSQMFSWPKVIIMIIVGAGIAVWGATTAIQSIGSGVGSTFKDMGEDSSSVDKQGDKYNFSDTILPGMSWYTIPENPQLSDFIDVE